MSIIFIMFLLILPVSGWGICFKDCQTLPPTLEQSPAPLLEQRIRSHNFRDVRNSVLGNVDIRVGHDHLEIGGIGQGNQNYIDASVQSTVILGDLKQ